MSWAEGATSVSTGAPAQRRAAGKAPPGAALEGSGVVKGLRAGPPGWQRGAAFHGKAPPWPFCPCTQEAGFKGQCQGSNEKLAKD